MTRNKHHPEDSVTLRRRAEQQAMEVSAQSPDDILNLPPEVRQRMLHELRVHQIELEMQNEELRRAQVELDASRARYFDLYDLAPVGYCSLSPKGLILEANLTAATMLNVARGALVNQPISRFILKDDQDIYYRHQKKLAEVAEAQACELRMRRADGPPLWVRLDSTAAPDETGAPVYRLVLSDISDRKRAEEEHETLREQLLQARKMESVGRLAGGVAHDFNNMLTVISGNAEMALGTLSPNHPLYQALEEILRAARRSAEVTRQLLAFASKQIVSPEVLALDDAIEGMLGKLRRLIGEDIRLVRPPHGRLWPVVMDPAQLEQLLVHLCLNAREAIAGTGEITIETDTRSFDETFCAKHPGYAPGDFVLLAVRDNGCGMDQATLDNLFEPFFSTKGMDQGAGLGLAVVYGIVRQNSGFVIVESEPRKGSAFHVHLPRHESSLPQSRKKAEPMPAEIQGGETILVVEDEPEILALTRLMLERLDYTVLAAGAPAEALRLAEEYSGRIDLILTDVIMPQMNGRELAGRLLAMDPHAKVLFISGYSADAIAHQGMLETGTQFLQKPFSRAQLAAMVRHTLTRDSTGVR
jgi:PAS domain S-box-containing protein